MSARVVHQPRVAWDFVQVLIDVVVAGEDLYAWFAGRVGEVLGTAYRVQLHDTRARLFAGRRIDIREVEMGVWRARLEDALIGEPDLAEDLRILRLDAAARLAGIPGV